MNLTIGRKLALIFGALIFILVLTGFVSYWAVKRINRNVLQLANVEEPLEEALLKVEINVGETARVVLGYLRDRDLERRVEERTTELVSTHHELIETARQVGMAVVCLAGTAFPVSLTSYHPGKLSLNTTGSFG